MCVCLNIIICTGQLILKYKKVKVGNDQEIVQSERIVTPQTEGWEIYINIVSVTLPVLITYNIMVVAAEMI